MSRPSDVAGRASSPGKGLGAAWTGRRPGLRSAAFAGRVYQEGVGRLTEQLRSYFQSRDGAGLPSPNGEASAESPPLRAVITPHIDFPRGGAVYSWAYRRLVEQSDARVFVVLGVAHQPCRSRFVLTRDDFATPLGRVPTDQAFVDRLVEQTDAPLFRDEAVHEGEHSIEFQAVFLKHVLRERPFTIVPVLVGSFHDMVRRRLDPLSDPEIARFIQALRSAEAAEGRKIAYIGSIDLCHVGPEFGDPEPLDARGLDEVRRFDRSMLDRAGAIDPTGWFRTASEIDDRRRVCGLAATYTMLHAIGPARGEILRYGQAVAAGGMACVSFASMAFHADPGAGAGLDGR